jgi:[ribosomal protein S18]-alanine N-acetyltransferase
VRQLVEPPALPVHIRPMRPEDLEAVMEIQRVSFKNPWSMDLFRREMSHDWSTILLAEQMPDSGSPRALGFLIFWLVHDEIHILNVATAPQARLQGIARTLLETALARGRQHRCALATLEVRRSNEAALGLYKAFGFRPVGIRPNYYVEESEDAVVMVLDL